MMRGSRNAKPSSAEEWTKAGSFMRKPDKGWLHSDQAIKEGGVCYALKYLGCIEVLRSMRSLQYDLRQSVTKEAMYRCCEANGYKFSKRKKPSKNVVKLLADHPRMTYSGRFISLTVSVSGIVLTEMSSGEIITNHDMQGISFANSGEKDCPDIVGYVAKDVKNKRACHVLDCPQNLSYDVINTIGQAFELRYKMFLHNPPQVLSTPKRFDAVFEDDDSAAYDEPKDVDNVFEDSHAYDCINEDKNVGSSEDEDKHEYKYPRPQNVPCKMSEYDTPNATLESPVNNEYFEIEDPNGHSSLEFAVGAHFDGQQMTTPSYNNPLESVSGGAEVDIIYDQPQDQVEDEKLPEFGVDFDQISHNNWETFEGSPPPRPSARPAFQLPPVPPQNTDDTNLNHDTLGYALPLPKKPAQEIERKTPPPLPKPFAERRTPDNLESTERNISVVEEDLVSNVWFHGPMARQDAENLLNCDGDFLVRESTTNPGQYVLTGQQNGYPKHLLLVDPKGVVRTRDQAFDSVSHLIRYHKEKKIPIISSGSVLILKQPVSKNSMHPQYDGPCN